MKKTKGRIVKRMLFVLLFCSMAILFIACTTTQDVEPDFYKVESYGFSYTSRDAQVPATVTFPVGGKNVPLVVLAHGHGGNRDEYIGFTAIAESLAEQGIASIRMDFPGCGESTESFQNNSLTYMKEDVVAGTKAAINILDVNENRVGLIGYSMGGRIALELLAENAFPYQAVFFLAPAADNEDLKLLFGGSEAWEKLKTTAKTNGYVDFTTVFGQQQELSKKFFEDIEAYENIAKAASEAFSGKNARVIYAVDDTVISPVVSKQVADLFNASIITTPADGHSYGFYSDRTDILKIVVDGATSFFDENL